MPAIPPSKVQKQFEKSAAPQPALMTIQLDSVTAYIQDTVDLASLAMQQKVSIDISTTPNNPTSPFYNMFPLEVVGDIVRINGETVKGLYLSKNLVTMSSSTAATAAPTGTPSTKISAGQMISNAKIVGFRHDIFKILWDPDPTVAPIEIGSITAAGVSGQPPIPPGGPLAPDGITPLLGGDWAITGGTGAFLGVTGQMGGQGGGPIRMASVREDPSQRQANAATGGPYNPTIGLYVIPLMPPQIIKVFHAASGNNPPTLEIAHDHPAKVGDALTLYATGLGPVRDQSGNVVPIGQPFPGNTTVISPVTLTIEGSPGLIEPQSAVGSQGYSNGYCVDFVMPSIPFPPLPGTTSIRISSAWIWSAGFTLYVAPGPVPPAILDMSYLVPILLTDV